MHVNIMLPNRSSLNIGRDVVPVLANLESGWGLFDEGGKENRTQAGRKIREKPATGKVAESWASAEDQPSPGQGRPAIARAQTEPCAS